MRLPTLSTGSRSHRRKSSADKVQVDAPYFEGRADRMRYADFRRQDLFVGSGVIEAGCRSVVHSRLKCSGLFWTVERDKTD